jgi:hypothetical protein
MNRVKLILEPRGEDGQVRREALNSPIQQGTQETIKYYFDFSGWGASSSNPCTTPVVTVLGRYDSDDTATIFSADDATVVSNVEVEFTLSAFSRYKWYRVYVKTTIGSEIGEAFCQMEGVR